MTTLESTWTTRDLPILRECLRRIDGGEAVVYFDDIRDAVGLDVAQMNVGMTALETASPPYIFMEGNFLQGVSERARRELGTWPSAETLVDCLAAALAEAADAEPEPEKKGKFRAAGEFLGNMGRDVAVAVISKQVGG